MVIVGSGSNPEIVSHGSRSGPKRMPLSVEAKAHNPPLTFLTMRGASLDLEPQLPDEEDATNAPTEE